MSTDIVETRVEHPNVKCDAGPNSYCTPLKLDRALAITGWMTVIEMAWLADQATRHKRIVELGSYLGRSTRVLGDNTPGIVIAIDEFGHCLVPKDGKNGNDIFDQFIANVQDLLESGKVHSIVGSHAHVNAEHMADQPPYDMVFIDGDHAYESVKRDIENWLPYVEVGGIICGHDFEDGFPGVMQAVLEKFHRHVQIVPGTSIWTVNIEA